MNHFPNDNLEHLPEETIVNLVCEHLVTSSHSNPGQGQRSSHGNDNEGTWLSNDDNAKIHVPYHLPGASVTHDIYVHANTLRPAMRRSMSGFATSPRQDGDPVLQNLGKPGGFRRFFVQQQQQQQHNKLEDAPTHESGHGHTASHMSPLSASSLAHVSRSVTNQSQNHGYTMMLHPASQTTTLESLKGIQTRHFLEYLAITSVLDHFAGEDLSASEDEFEDNENTTLLSPPSWKRRKHKLPHRQNDESESEENHKASTAKTALLLFKAFISSGILFLPKAFSNGGLVFSIVTLYFMGIVSLYCFLLLLECKKHIPGSYGDIGGKLYGSWMRKAVLFSIAISQLGFTCGGTIFIVENIIQATQNLFHEVVLPSNDGLLVLVAMLLMPLVLIRNIAKLSPAALLADVLIVAGLTILIGYDIWKMFFIVPQGMHPPVIGPDVYWSFNPISYPVFIGTAVYSFEGIGLIIPIRDSMETPQKFPMVLTLVMGLVATALCLVGSLGYLAFGSKVNTVALLNLPSGILGSTVQLGYAAAVHLTNPLALYPTIRIVEHAWFGERTGKHNAKVKWQKNTLRCGIVVICAWIAWFGAEDLDKFISLIGSVCCCPLSLIFPPMFHLCLPTTKGIWRLMDHILIVFGVGIMLFTLWSTSQQWGAPT